MLKLTTQAQHQMTFITRIVLIRTYYCFSKKNN